MEAVDRTQISTANKPAGFLGRDGKRTGNTRQSESYCTNCSRASMDSIWVLHYLIGKTKNHSFPVFSESSYLQSRR